MNECVHFCADKLDLVKCSFAEATVTTCEYQQCVALAIRLALIRGDCWASAGLCALLTAILVIGSLCRL